MKEIVIVNYIFEGENEFLNLSFKIQNDGF